MLCNRRRIPAITLSALLLAALGCGGLGLPGGGGTTRPAPEADRVVTGEVAWVDADRRELEVQHRTGRVVARFDDRTPVFFQGQQYRPENLEPGDVVRMDVGGSGYQSVYAERIEVLESVSHRGDDSRADDRYGDDRSGAGRLTGTVEWVDERRGEFGLRTDDRETWTVQVPFDARDSVRDRFAALDRGDYVRIEAEELGRDRVTLLRFL